VSKIAEVIHLSSTRSKAPFVKRAAAGLGPGALAAALTEAEGGTLFLDEIGQLPADSQLALVDGTSQARLIGGTARDLSADVAAGVFHADLYYRLDVGRVRIPSLSERPEDIEVLFRHYVAQASEQGGLTPPEISPDVVADLMARDWPGNTRALMSEAMRFALRVDDHGTPEGQGLVEKMARVERSFLVQALERCAGNASAAAESLKLPRKTFYDKLARHSLKPEAFRKD
jgi:two-component system C4-dicarboxylate transport response regulator DctD